MQKKTINQKDPSMAYRTLDSRAVKAPNKKKDDPRVQKTVTSGDLRAPKGR